MDGCRHGKGRGMSRCKQASSGSLPASADPSARPDSRPRRDPSDPPWLADDFELALTTPPSPWVRTVPASPSSSKRLRCWPDITRRARKGYRPVDHSTALAGIGGPSRHPCAPPGCRKSPTAGSSLPNPSFQSPVTWTTPRARSNNGPDFLFWSHTDRGHAAGMAEGGPATDHAFPALFRLYRRSRGFPVRRAGRQVLS